MARMPQKDWEQLLTTMGQLNIEMHHWAERTGNLSKYKAWSNAYQMALSMMETMTPGEAAEKLRAFTDYTHQVMKEDWWSWIKSTTRGAIISLASHLDKVEEAAKQVVETASRAVEYTAGKAVSALKPILVPAAILGGGVVLFMLLRR